MSRETRVSCCDVPISAAKGIADVRVSDRSEAEPASKRSVTDEMAKLTDAYLFAMGISNARLRLIGRRTGRYDLAN